jgi:hypothetical protein
MTAGGVGEQSIAGQFTFVEDGKTIPLNLLVNMCSTKTKLCYNCIK